jgi:hypothetical protein
MPLVTWPLPNFGHLKDTKSAETAYTLWQRNQLQQVTKPFQDEILGNSGRSIYAEECRNNARITIVAQASLLCQMTLQAGLLGR